MAGTGIHAWRPVADHSCDLGTSPLLPQRGDGPESPRCSWAGDGRSVKEASPEDILTRVSKTRPHTLRRVTVSGKCHNLLNIFTEHNNYYAWQIFYSSGSFSRPSIVFCSLRRSFALAMHARRTGPDRARVRSQPRNAPALGPPATQVRKSATRKSLKCRPGRESWYKCT